MKTYAQKKLVTKSWKQMLFSFNEIFLKTNSTLIVFFYKWISCYCTYYFLNAYVSNLCYVLATAKMLHPFVTNSSMLISVGLFFHSMTHIISIPYSSPKSWLTFNFMFTNLGKNIQKNFLPLKTITQQHFAYTISLCSRCF